jgi:hypothetical protein
MGRETLARGILAGEVGAWEKESEQMDGAKNHDKPNGVQIFLSKHTVCPANLIWEMRSRRSSVGQGGLESAYPTNMAGGFPELRDASSCICIGTSASYRKGWKDNGPG